MSKQNFSAVTLGDGEFSEFQEYLKKISGIDLGDNKQYLVTTRLRRILIDNHIDSLSDLLVKIKSISGTQLRQQVIDVMTTNETFWFRDSYPFEYLSKVLLPKFVKENSRQKIRIWCAACSSGQEPYSISMLVEEFMRSGFGHRGISLEIVATDLSNEILTRAKMGIYDQLSMSRGLSDARLKTFFEPDGVNAWKAKDLIKRRVEFRQLNLQDSFASLGKFDIVFCRNVLIYFSADLKTDILKRIHGALKPSGYLFLGASESLSGAASSFDMVHCSPGVMYQAK